MFSACAKVKEPKMNHFLFELEALQLPLLCIGARSP